MKNADKTFSEKAGKTRWPGMRMAISVLSGNASSFDHELMRDRAIRDRNPVNEDVHYYRRAAQTIDGEAYDTQWIDAPEGAYCLLLTRIAVDERNWWQIPYKSPQVAVKDVCYVAFSADNDLLYDAITKSPDALDYPSDDSLKKNICVTDHCYLLEDLLNASAERLDESFTDLSWLQKGITNHSEDYNSRNIKHGLFKKTSDNLYRSGSSLIWFHKRAGRNNDLYDCYYYSNPMQAEERIFLSNDALPRWKALKYLSPKWWAMRSLSVKASAAPIQGQDREEFARKIAHQTGNDIMRFKDPYLHLNRPRSLHGRILRSVKTGILRPVQEMVKIISKTDTKKTGISVAFTIAINIVMALAFATKAVAIGTLELARRSINAGIRTASKHFMPPKRGVEGQRPGFAHIMAAQDNQKTFTDLANMRAINPLYIKYASPVSAVQLRGIYTNAKDYDESAKAQERRDNRTRKYLLDTQRFPVGTIHAEEKKGSRHYSVYVQPEGTIMYRDQERPVAFLRSSCMCVEGAHSQRDLHDVMLSTKGKNQWLAMEYIPHSNVAFETVQNIGEMPANFTSREPTTREYIMRSSGIDLSQNGRHTALTLDKLWTEAVRPSLLKRIFNKDARKKAGNTPKNTVAKDKPLLLSRDWRCDL